MSENYSFIIIRTIDIHGKRKQYIGTKNILQFYSLEATAPNNLISSLPKCFHSNLCERTFFYTSLQHKNCSLICCFHLP